MTHLIEHAGCKQAKWYSRIIKFLNPHYSFTSLHTRNDIRRMRWCPEICANDLRIPKTEIADIMRVMVDCQGVGGEVSRNYTDVFIESDGNEGSSSAWVLLAHAVICKHCP